MQFNCNYLLHLSLIECRPCPAGMEPALGFEYKWWNVLPGNMKTSCFNVGNSKCDGMNGEFRIGLPDILGHRGSWAQLSKNIPSVGMRNFIPVHWLLDCLPALTWKW